MTRKTTRNYSLSVVAPFFAILTLLLAATVPAQVTDADQLHGNAVSGAAGVRAPAEAERPLIPWTDHDRHFPPSRAQAKPQGRMDTSPPLFLPVVTHGSGGVGANSVIAADLNGDGKNDLVVTNYQVTDDSPNGSVAVLLGKGNGMLQTAVTYGSGGLGAFPAAVSDINGDGKLDIVVANTNSAVGVLLGNGDGTFAPTVSYSSGGWATMSVAIADVNGDGKPDLAVANYDNATLGVLLGKGDGTFQSVVTYALGFTPPAVALEDVNGDGKPDLLATDPGGFVGVLLGNGDGTFHPVVTYASGGFNTNSVAVSDVNGDGNPDLVLANPFPSTVGVLLGNGDGTFRPVATYDAGGVFAGSVAVADLNLDGKMDIAVANCASTGSEGCSGNGVVGVLFGNGDGTFEPVMIYDSAGRIATWVSVADMNGDGKPDLLLTNTFKPSTLRGSVGVLLNNPQSWITNTALVTSTPISFVGQTVTFTATVTPGNWAIPNGEVVTFYDGKTTLGSIPLAGGTAAFTTSSLSAKTHTIKAIYAGDATFKPSTGSVTQVVDKYPTTTALSSSPNPSVYGQAVTFTATVTPTGPSLPTGKVLFKDGTLGIGSVTLSSGVATLTKSRLAVGTHPITARYVGDAASAKSTSPVLNQVVK